MVRREVSNREEIHNGGEESVENEVIPQLRRLRTSLVAVFESCMDIVRPHARSLRE